VAGSYENITGIYNVSLPDHNISGFSEIMSFRIAGDGSIKFFGNQNDPY